MKKYSSIILMFVGICLLTGLSAAGNVKSVEEDIPRLEITLNDVSLEEIHAGDKTISYDGTRVEVFDPLRGNGYIAGEARLRGRGNSSWKMPKRSYQIKFPKKTELLGMGAAKKWLLIANYADASLMRNRLMYDLAGALMDYAPDSRYVDLWIDGEFQGNYLLCEKLEIGGGGLALQDERGLLIEIDNIYYYQEEHEFQSPISGGHFALKDAKNDGLALEAFADFEAYVQKFETLLYAEEKDWEQLSRMMDVESFVKFYYLEELAENSDSCRTSLYLYQDGPEDVLHMGPVWDFDKAVGYSMRGKYGGDTQRDYVRNIEEYMGTGKDLTWYTELFQIPEFCREAERIYQEEIHPVFLTAGERIEGYREELKHSAERNFERWDITEIPEECDHEPYLYENWDQAAEGLKSWVQERTEYLGKTNLPS